MANDSINTIVDKQAYDQLNKLQSDLNKTHMSLLDLLETAAGSKGIFRGIAMPSQLEAQLNKTASATRQLNDSQKEQERIQKALVAAQNKFYSAQSGTNRQLQQTRHETNILNQKAREHAVISSKLSTEYQKQSAILNKLRREYKDMALKYGENSKQARKLQKEVTTLDAKLKRVDANVGQHQRNVGNYGSSWSKVGGIMRSVVAAFGIYSGIEIARQIFTQIKEIDALNKALLKVTETQEGFNQATFFLRDVAEIGGLEINKLQRAYTKFYASAKNTNLTLEETQSIFRNVALSAAAMGLSTEDTEGAMRALEQMLSKGNVQAEEIRGQLGERLPGAFQILAKSMGLTTQELNKQLQLGNVLAEDVLPKFAEELAKAYDVDDQPVETLIAAQNRLSNSWTEFVTTLSDSEGTISTIFKNILIAATEVVDAIAFMNNGKDTARNDSYQRVLVERSEMYKKLGKDANSYAEIDQKNATRNMNNIKDEINLLKQKNEEFSDGAGWITNASIISRNNKKITQLSNNLSVQTAIRNAAARQLENHSEWLKKDTEETNENSNSIKKNTDLKKEAKTILAGSVDAYKKIISELEDERDRLSTNAEEYQAYQEKIEAARKELEKLTEAQEKVEDVFGGDYSQEGTAKGAAIADPSENDINEWQQHLRDKADVEIEIEEEKQKALAYLRKLGVENVKDLSDDELKVVQDAMDLQLELGQQLQDSLQDVVVTSIMSIANARVQAVDDEIQANRGKYATLLDNEELSQEQRDSIEAERDRKEVMLEKKRREREKEAFLIKQGLALADIGISLAQSLAAINAAAAAMDLITPFLFGATGTAYRAANIPLAIGVAAAQTASVVAATIPQFAKGKDASDPYEGDMIWGEKQPEVKVDKYGNIEVATKPTYGKTKKGDTIYPSFQDFGEDFNIDNLISASILTSLASQGEKISGYDLANVFDEKLEQLDRKITNGIKEGFRNMKIVNKNSNDNSALLTELKRARKRDV